MEILIRAIVAVVIAVASSGVLQPGTGNGVPEIHAPSVAPIAVGSVKGVEAFRGTPRPDPSAKPSERPSSATKKAGPRPATPSPVRTKPVARPGAIQKGANNIGGLMRTSGSATWYCCTRGYVAGEYVAAAGPALRVGHWRGRYVTVYATSDSGADRAIRVRLVDWCGCPGHVIDLHPAAFRALAPLWRGVVSVRVSW